MRVRHGGNIWMAARQFGGDPDDYIDFSSNINPLGPPQAVWAVGQAALQQIDRYPEPQAKSFCDTAATHYGVPTGWVVAGNGAAELIAAIPMVFALDQRDSSGASSCGFSSSRVIIIQPTFAQYAQAARRTGRAVIEIKSRPQEGFMIDGSDVISHVQPGDIVFLCQPNNPTGRMMPNDDYVQLIKALCERGAYPVLDESFIGFVRGAVSGVELLRAGYPVAVIQSLTKLYALPGLRLGVALLPEKWAQAMENLLVPWRVNVLAGEIGKVCLEDVDYVKRTQLELDRLRTDLADGLQTIPGIHPLPGAANFLLIDVRETGLSASRLMTEMAKHRILVRDTSNFPRLGHGYIRIAVRSADDNARLLDVLRWVVKK